MNAIWRACLMIRGTKTSKETTPRLVLRVHFSNNLGCFQIFNIDQMLARVWENSGLKTRYSETHQKNSQGATSPKMQHVSIFGLFPEELCIPTPPTDDDLSHVFFCGFFFFWSPPLQPLNTTTISSTHVIFSLSISTCDESTPVLLGRWRTSC